MTEVTTQNQKHIELPVYNKRPVVPSTEIARNFNRDHDDILEAIQALGQMVTPEWFKDNFSFEPVERSSENEAEKIDTVCFMTRDGFSSLPIALTGKKAQALRCQYLQAFAEIEAILRQKTYDKYLKKGAGNYFPDNKPANCMAIIEGLLGFWANQDGLPYKTVNKLLCSHLYISTLEDMQIDQFHEACQFITQSACFLANKGQEMAPEKMENIQRLLDAAEHFQHSGGLVGDELLHSLCGASMTSIPQVDGIKMLSLAWGVFKYSEGYNFGFKRGQDAIIKNLVR